MGNTLILIIIIIMIGYLVHCNNEKKIAENNETINRNKQYMIEYEEKLKEIQKHRDEKEREYDDYMKGVK